MPAKLLNFLFEVEQFCKVLNIDMQYESVKLAMTMLTSKALTWWRSVASEQWATLGICDWATFQR